MAGPPIFHRLFVANRGEVAARVARTAERMGIAVVFGVSEADRDAPWTDGHEQVVLGPARAAQSYLDPVRVIQAAKQSHCSALHPGWGFLAESPLLAALCEQHGVTFVGPPAHAMWLMGKKTPAKGAMRRAGMTLIPGSEGILSSADHALEVADTIGYPVLLKAESGGGGRGMRIARSRDEVARAYEDASAEALAAFGDPRLYLEKLVEGGRHVEIQVMCDRYGSGIHVGERDCTVQRNHQKLIEESPSPVLDAAERARALESAVRAAVSIGYVGAGTMELLLDRDTGDRGTLRFMEMNTRLQVEHCGSEARSGLDLVAMQLEAAAGHRLKLAQDDVKLEGHAIECRINAEDPTEGFRPCPGVITRFELPRDHEGLRFDTHVVPGYEVPPHYDSLICKAVARGRDRNEACDRMISALEAMRVEGVRTTIPMHLAILRSPDFREHRYDTRTIPGWS
ncbi:MAG: ATP-grasp domain-containing protein [Thermoanaerobaculia bacterium]|nr:ATP-grasp domain-containing protein [Thermoanaerobaculia bacterium]